MEQSIFIVDENNCIESTSNNQWDFVNQHIICHLNSIGIKVYRVASATRLIKNIPFDLCKIAGIEVFFDNIYDEGLWLVLQKGDMKYIIHPDRRMIIEQLSAVLNHFMEKEKIVVLSINFNRVLFFKAPISFIEEFMNYIEVVNKTLSNSDIYLERDKIVN
jgi:hypothetical protein